MIKIIIAAAASTLLMSACSSTPTDPAEKQKNFEERVKRCKKLKQEADELRGKPIRRNAALEYYQQECTVDGDIPPPAPPVQ